MKFRKIVRHNLTEPILQLKKAGKSLRDINAEIRQKYGVDIGVNQIMSFLNERPAIIAQRICMDEELEKKHVEVIIDTNRQLVELNEDMRSFYNTVKRKYENGEEKSQNVIRAADHLLAELRLVAELLGRINQKKVLNLSFHDQATNVQKILDKLYKDKKLYCKRCKSRDIAFDLTGDADEEIIEVQETKTEEPMEE